MSIRQNAARDLPNLQLEDALQLVHLCAERGSPKFERAAMRWLERYLTEASPPREAVREIWGEKATGEVLDMGTEAKTHV